MNTIQIGLAVLLASAASLACKGSDDPESSSESDGAADSSADSDTGDTVPQADCLARCEAHATACQAPPASVSQVCGDLCGESLSDSALDCIEALPCTAGEDELDACTNEGPPVVTGGPGDGEFGDACTCDGASGEWECSGADICATGLVCVGSGGGPGTCVGPRCCDGESDCADKLGTQASCASGQKCACTGGELECVGETCTCPGGVVPDRGLCYPE
jgi:hypothetical protein